MDIEGHLAPSRLFRQAVVEEWGSILVAVEPDEEGPAAIYFFKKGHTAFQVYELIEIVLVQSHPQVHKVNLKK